VDADPVWIWKTKAEMRQWC